MKRYFLTALLAGSVVYASTSFADEEQKTTIEEEGRVHITWQSYDKYRDIKPSNQSRSKFRRNVFKQFDKHFEKLAKSLPEDYLLKLTVTNIDLAGMVFPNNGPIPIRGGFINMGQTGMDIRVMEQVHVPRMDFEFELLDNNGQVVLSDSVKLKDMAFIDRATTIEPSFSETIAKQ
jgi:hypothetical protein